MEVTKKREGKVARRVSTWKGKKGRGNGTKKKDNRKRGNKINKKREEEEWGVNTKKDKD